MPLHPYIVPLPIAVFTDAAPARLGWRVAFLGGRCGAGILGLCPKPRQGLTEGMRKGSVTTERCHTVPAKGRNRTAQIENLGCATRGPVGHWAKPKATRRISTETSRGHGQCPLRRLRLRTNAPAPRSFSTTRQGWNVPAASLLTTFQNGRPPKKGGLMYLGKSNRPRNSRTICLN